MVSKRELIKENELLKEWSSQKEYEYKTFGVMTVEIPMNATKEKIDELLGMVQQRMNAEMKRLNVDLDWVIMPSVVKTVETITVELKKEEKE